MFNAHSQIRAALKRPRVRKAIFPVAGLGTRFLPATKAMPKEMLTVVDRPLIQYAVDEALAAGIEQLIFVTGRGKAALEDHFDLSFELETLMAQRGKCPSAVAGTRHAPGSIITIRQQEPLGLGHAIWCARDIVGDEPFAVLLPDELMVSKPGCLTQLVRLYEEQGGNMVATIEVDAADVSKYGIVTPGERGPGWTEITGLVEKPRPQDAPSNLAIAGRYILEPEIMAALGSQQPGAGGEIQLTDAMANLLGERSFTAMAYKGQRFDCGSKLGWLSANIALALKDPELAPTLSLLFQNGAEPPSGTHLSMTIRPEAVPACQLLAAELTGGKSPREDVMQQVKA